MIWMIKEDCFFTLHKTWSRSVSWSLLASISCLESSSVFIIFTISDTCWHLSDRSKGILYQYPLLKQYSQIKMQIRRRSKILNIFNPDWQIETGRKYENSWVCIILETMTRIGWDGKKIMLQSFLYNNLNHWLKTKNHNHHTSELSFKPTNKLNVYFIQQKLI